MAYTQKRLLDLATRSRSLARGMRSLQHDPACPPTLQRALKQARHALGISYGGLQVAAERVQDVPTGQTTPDLAATIDAVQSYYRFTDFRSRDRAQQADRARASLIYVLTHDEGFSIGQVARALQRDDAAVCKARDHAQRDIIKAANTLQQNDIARYVQHMRAILKGAQARAV